MHYLITGIAGFIGSNLAVRLLEDGHRVRGIDNLSTGRMENIAPFLGDLEFIEGDIRDLDMCRKACEGVDRVLHQAALGSVPRSVKDPVATHESNATGTLNMLVASHGAEVESFVFAASSSAYGNTEELPKHEGMEPRPLSPYAVTKVACEHYLKVFAQIYGLNTVGLRYFNIFGPRQDPNGAYAAVIPKFIDCMQADTAPTIYGDGEQTRDFTFIDNAVQANLKAAERAPQVAGEIFNIGCGERVSLTTLFEHLAEFIGFEGRPIHGDPRAGDVRDSLADISKARQRLGYEPTVDVREGLQRTVEWYLARR